MGKKTEWQTDLQHKKNKQTKKQANDYSENGVLRGLFKNKQKLKIYRIFSRKNIIVQVLSLPSLPQIFGIPFL